MYAPSVGAVTSAPTADVTVCATGVDNVAVHPATTVPSVKVSASVPPATVTGYKPTVKLIPGAVAFVAIVARIRNLCVFPATA